MIVLGHMKKDHSIPGHPQSCHCSWILVSSCQFSIVASKSSYLHILHNMDSCDIRNGFPVHNDHRLV